MRRRTGALLLVLLASACDDPVPPAPAPKSAALPPPPKPPPAEGCARTGSLDAIETDPTCLVSRVSDDVNRNALKHAKLKLDIEPETVMAGAGALLRVTITNGGSTEALFVFDAQPRAAGPRVDWTRIVGVPDVKPTSAEPPKLLFLATTLDSHEHNVDAPPTISNPAGTPASTLHAVRVRAGGKLTHTISWWALKIPPPAPIVTDDAGHRYIPKTAAIPLYPGEYSIAVEVPLHGIPTPERIVTARVHVEKSTAAKPPP